MQSFWKINNFCPEVNYFYDVRLVCCFFKLNLIHYDLVECRCFSCNYISCDVNTQCFKNVIIINYRTNNLISFRDAHKVKFDTKNLVYEETFSAQYYKSCFLTLHCHYTAKFFNYLFVTNMNILFSLLFLLSYPAFTVHCMIFVRNYSLFYFVLYY